VVTAASRGNAPVAHPVRSPARSPLPLACCRSPRPAPPLSATGRRNPSLLVHSRRDRRPHDNISA
jgi:hypothetical protein